MGIDAVLNGIAIGGVYALVAVGLSLVYGVLHVINLSHTEMLMLGGYLALILAGTVGLPVIVAAIASLAVVGALGFGIDRFLLRPFRTRRISEDEQLLSTVIVTLGVSFFTANAVFAVMGSDVRRVPSMVSGHVDILGGRLAFQQIVIIVVSLLAVAGLFVFLRRTRLGLGIRAVSQNPEAAQMTGVNRNLAYGITFAISVVLAALSGILIGPIYYVFPFMGFIFIVKSFLLIILGGLGSLEGALIAAFGLGLVESVLSTYFSVHIGTIAFFALAILVLTFRPSGILGYRGRTV